MRSRGLLAIPILLVLPGCGLLRKAVPVPATTPLADAVILHDPVKVKALLNAGADPNQPFGPKHSTCIGRAVYLVCTARVSVGGTKPWSGGPVDDANRAEVVRLLVANGADVNQENTEGVTAIFSAASCGDVEYIRKLAQWGADMNRRNKGGRTPLHEAAGQPFYWHDSSPIKAMAECGADVNARDRNGRTALHIVVATWDGGSEPRSPWMVAANALLDAGADVNAEDLLGLRPLDYAGTPGMVALLKRKGAKGYGE